MKKMVITSLLFVVPLSVFAKTATKSVYTDLKNDCIVVSEATEMAPIDFFSSECKAFGGYGLKEAGGDLRYGPELSFAGKEIDLQRPGSFHEMGSQKIEWVYDISRDEEGSGALKFKALIYRLKVADNRSERDNSVLFVVKLDGKKSCVTGTAKTNEAARALANNKSAKCVTLKW